MPYLHLLVGRACRIHLNQAAQDHLGLTTSSRLAFFHAAGQVYVAARPSTDEDAYPLTRKQPAVRHDRATPRLHRPLTLRLESAPLVRQLLQALGLVATPGGFQIHMGTGRCVVSSPKDRLELVPLAPTPDAAGLDQPPPPDYARLPCLLGRRTTFQETPLLQLSRGWRFQLAPRLNPAARQLLALHPGDHVTIDTTQQPWRLRRCEAPAGYPLRPDPHHQADDPTAPLCLDATPLGRALLGQLALPGYRYAFPIVLDDDGQALILTHQARLLQHADRQPRSLTATP